MGSYPVTEVWQHGEFLTYDLMQRRITQPLDFLVAPPRVYLYRSTAGIFINNNTATPIPWSLSQRDTDDMWAATSPTVIKPKTPGWYIGSVSMSWHNAASVNTGERIIYVAKNNGTDPNLMYHKFPANSTAGKFQNTGDIPIFGYFNGINDYCEVVALQTNGTASTMAVFNSEGGKTSFDLRWFAQ